MQAYAEGFDLFDKSRVRPRQGEDRPPVDAGLGRALVAVRARGAARSSRRATTSPSLTAHTADSGEGRWTIEDAMDKDVPDAGHHRVACTRASTAAATATSPHRMLARAARAVRRPRGHAAGRREHGGATAENPLAEGLERLPGPPDDARHLRRDRRPRRGASCCPRSTTSPTRARCPSASTSSASRAREHDRRGLPRAGASSRSASSRAASPTTTCSTKLLRRRRATSPGTFDEPEPSTSGSTTALRRVRRGRRARRSTAASTCRPRRRSSR